MLRGAVPAWSYAQQPGYKSKSFGGKYPPSCARLGLTSARATLKRAKYSGGETKPFQANVVQVWEPRPSKNKPAVERICHDGRHVKAEYLERVVDIHRLHGSIEEYFRALKTGCSLAKRQANPTTRVRPHTRSLMP